MVKRRTKLDDLMNETLIEILLRVPVKTAHQCKLISKRWLSLISSPFFVRCHRHRHRDHLLLVNFDYGNISAREVKSIPENNHSVSIDFLNHQFGSNTLFFVSNDLLLTLSGSGDAPKILCISNLLTKQSFSLPKMPFGFGEPKRIFVVFRGCICSVDDPTLYKVVVVVQRRSSPEFFNINVFSSDTTDWSMFVVPRPLNFSYATRIEDAEGQYATTIDGALYWCTNMIIIYDPFNNPQHCDFIHLPQDAIYKKVHRLDDSPGLCIANVEQHLRLYHYRHYNFASTSQLSIWDMEDHKSARTWIVKCFVDLTSIDWLSVNISNYMWLAIKGFNPNDGDVLYVLSNDDKRLLAVNLVKKTVQLVFQFKPNSGLENSRMFQYVPPLWPTPITKSTAVAAVL